jgi:hypothetical protein
MVNATVDNTPVNVLLDDNESYSPASGSVQKVTVVVNEFEALNITRNGSTLQVVSPNEQEAVEMVLTDNETLVSDSKTSGGIFITGFEVS